PLAQLVVLADQRLLCLRHRPGVDAEATDPEVVPNGRPARPFGMVGVGRELELAEVRGRPARLGHAGKSGSSRSQSKSESSRAKTKVPAGASTSSSSRLNVARPRATK